MIGRLSRRALGGGLLGSLALAVTKRASARAEVGGSPPSAGSSLIRVDDAGMTLAQRTIPWPTSISAKARAALRAAAQRPSAPLPDPADPQAWRTLIEQVNRGMAAALPADDPRFPVATEQLAGVTVHRARPTTTADADRRLYIEIHGGGLVCGAGPLSRSGAIREARLHGVEALAIDYRMPPDHRYPAALDDCFAVYAAEVAKRGADNIIVGGASGGGYLAAALMLRAREAGLAMPRAMLLLSPRVDMTESGDTILTLMDIDPVLKGRLAATAQLYAGGHSLTDPLLSPLYGDLRGFPPTLLQSGTRDLYLSNAARMHRALRSAGVAAELHVFEAMPHGRFFGGAPEDEELDREMQRFVASHWLGTGGSLG